jgi:outer membrane protein assembly factor BamB
VMARRWFLLALLLGLSTFAAAAWSVEDLTFIQVSDLHTPYMSADAALTIGSFPTGPIQLATGLTVPAPSFVVATGDVNEFGGGSGFWEQYLSLWKQIPLPVYNLPGNHDNTWECMRPRLRAAGQAPFMALERGGVKIILWDTATPQDPRPSVATEGLRWLEQELSRTPPEQPVIFCCHHPLDGTEYGGAYERARLLDVLATRNVVAMLVGHGHGIRHWVHDGFDVCMGGSTYGAKRGYAIVSIKDNTLRVGYQYLLPAPTLSLLMEKPLPARSPFLQVTSLEPPDGQVFQARASLRWRVAVDRPRDVAKAKASVDGGDALDMTRDGDGWSAAVDTTTLAPGAHTIRLQLTDATGTVTSRTRSFLLEDWPFRVLWRRQLLGSCQSTPAVHEGRLYVGDNSGTLSAFDAATGDPLWTFPTGGEVRSGPIMVGNLICFASADGHLRALDETGSLRWDCDMGGPTYATPALAGDRLVCGLASGQVVAVDARSGRLLWRAKDPKYAIEVAPATDSTSAYFGAWDRYVYAFRLADGSLRWKALSKGASGTGAAQYYSPADAPPVAAGGRVFVADRAYALTILDATTGAQVGTADRCAALATAEDGKAVYARRTDGRLTKLALDGKVLWDVQVPAGAVATPPVAAAGRVWLISSLGTLSVLTPEGALVAQLKAFPDLFAFAAPAVDGNRVFLADAAGCLTALELRAP